MYNNRINHLKEMHKVLDEKIAKHEKDHPHSEQMQVQEWKKQKLMLKDEISRLVKLQWEEEHERINIDDDR